MSVVLTDAEIQECRACGHATPHNDSGEMSDQCGAVVERTEYPCEKHAPNCDPENCDTPPPDDCWVGLTFCGCSPTDRELAALRAELAATRKTLAWIAADEAEHADHTGACKSRRELREELATLKAKLSDEGLERLAPVIHRVFLAFTVCEGDACPVCRNRIVPLLREWRDAQ